MAPNHTTAQKFRSSTVYKILNTHFTLRYVSGNPALYLPQEHDSYLTVSLFALALHEHFETNPYRI